MKEKKIKVLLICPRFGTVNRGVESFAKEFVSRLDKNQFDLTVLSGNHHEIVEHVSFVKKKCIFREKLKFIDTLDGVSFTDNIQIRFAFGHTDSMMLPQISYKGKTILYMADMLPSVGHIPMPYVMSYDMFPLKTLKEKKKFLEEAVQNDYILFFEHDPVNECCTLQETEKGIRVKDTFKLSEI